MSAPDVRDVQLERCPHPYGGNALRSLIPPGSQRVLDFGCDDGAFLASLTGVPELYGCDINPERVERARANVPRGKFVVVGATPETPFEDNFFDAVTLLSVLEHVPDERALLAEIHRILKPGGRAIVLVPHKGLFAFADPGNVKFRFPRLHKLVHLMSSRSSRDEYARRFEGQSKEGTIGCHSNRWHVHYSAGELKALLHDHFEVERMHGFCLFNHILSSMHTASSLVFRSARFPVVRMFEKLVHWDFNVQPGRASAFIVVAARKRATA
ncbi:MAG TPA: class I SAM-dependent methyltransferase [Burkholderiales bacterium]|nr:class I SAM-dependent methyltransferase [Burkholderiales bacterium]